MNSDINKKRKKRINFGNMLVNLLFCLGIVILLAAAATIYFKQETQLARIREKAAELNTQVVAAREKKKENEDLFKKLESLEYIEKIAREKLGMVKPGETLFPD
ncbi:MAG: FtsB family cell division protein [Saccharofermentanales bacterium]